MLIIKSAAKKPLFKVRKHVISAAAFAVLAMTPQVHAGVTLPPPIGSTVLLGTTSFKLSDVGYQQSEYFISGTAKSYTNLTPLGSDGKWLVAPADQANFKTRFVVYRPTDATKFNGTVIVEWFNVSGGTDASSQWIMTHTELIRKGYAWVGVTAQKAGIDGGPSLTGLNLTLKSVGPLRYSSLSHPGDKYAYDIFSQAAKAVMKPAAGAPNPLSGLQPKRFIAAGESQSADFMLTYANAIAPIERLFDGYFIHSRVHGTTGLAPDTNTIADFASRSSVKLRDDLGVPAMMIETETDLTMLGALADRQDDSNNIRVWEVAGASHADNYVSTTGLPDLGTDPSIANVVENNAAIPVLVKCDQPVNSGPQHFVINAAISALDNWIRNGVVPPHADRLQLSGSPATYVRDSFGNAVGGVRTPYVDAPVATLLGEGNTFSGTGSNSAAKNTLCGLFGTTHLLSTAQLKVLYPDHATFVASINATADDAVIKGFLLKLDADLIKAWAAASTIGN